MAEKKESTPKTDDEWKTRLTPEQYRVLREKSTEMPFTGKLLFNKEKGAYCCAGCGTPLFSSDNKFDSNTGWPSFWKPLGEKLIKYKEDKEFGMTRTEVMCAKCGGHLGHVFDDGPQPTGKRYCINSCSLGFEKK